MIDSMALRTCPSAAFRLFLAWSLEDDVFNITSAMGTFPPGGLESFCCFLVGYASGPFKDGYATLA